MSKHLKYRVSLLLAALLLPAIAFSDVVILAPDSDSARDIAKQIQLQIEEPSVVAHKLDPTQKSDIVVAIGDGSFEGAVKSQTGPVVGTFLSSTSALPTSEKPLYRVFSDPSPEVISKFLKANFSNKAVGYIYSPSEEDTLRILQQSLSGSTVKLVASKHSGNTNSDIRTLIKDRIDTMFISRNRDIYKPETIRFTLEQLFRKRIPVITSVPALIKVGATGSISPTTSSVIAATADTVNSIAKGVPPKDVNLFVNEIDVQINDSMSELFEMHLEGGQE